MKKILLYINKHKPNKDQLAFDLTIILSIIFYQVHTDATGMKVFQMFSTDVAYVMCLFFLFTLSLSCGRLHLQFASRHRYFGYIILFVTVLLVMFPLTFSSKVQGAESTGIIAVFTTATGFAIGRFIVPNNITKTLEHLVLLLLLIPMSAGVILWMLENKTGAAGILICIFGFLAVALLGLLIDWLFRKNVDTINTWGNSAGFKRFTNLLLIVIAGLTAFAVCTWEESMFDTATMDGGYRIFMMSITGILPYRILWALAPPINKINAIVATIVMVINILIVYLG